MTSLQRTSWRALGAMLTGVIASTGCYTFVPVDDVVPDAGTEVRLALSPVQDFDVGAITIRDVNRMEGLVYQTNGDTIAVWTDWLYSLSGNRYYANGEIHSVERTAVPRLYVRRLNAPFTVGLLVGTAAVGTGLWFFATDVGSSSGGPPGPGGDTQSMVRPGILK